MGALYDEEEELDFSFLKQSVRQQPKGAAERRRTVEGSRDKKANSISQSRQVQMIQGINRQSRTAPGSSRQIQARQSRRGTAIPKGDKRSRAPQGRSGEVREIRGKNRNGTGRPATMQEKQAMLAVRKKRRLRRQRQLLTVMLCILLAGTALVALWLRQEVPEPMRETGGQTVSQVQAEGTGQDFVWGTVQGIPESQFNGHPEWTEDFLTIREYSRPGEPLEEVKNIFVHYTANPNTSAAQNRNYFENLKDNHDVRGASAHFIIGINGEILQIVPLDEIAYAVQTRNGDSISIECCFKNQNGQFTQETYDSLIELLAWLVSTYQLEPDDILRHYDCGGKKCPLYYVDHEDAWRILKQDVADRIAGLQ